MRFRTLTIIATGILTSIAHAQWNIDLTLGAGRWAGGPDSSFPGAANQPGFWDPIDFAPIDTPIRNIYGAYTGVTVTASGGAGSGNGFDNPLLNDNFEKVLGDGGIIGDGGNTYTFSGLPLGPVEVFTFAVRPSGGVSVVPVTVSNSITTNPQYVTGPIPANQWIEGVTQARHLAMIVDGTLVIHVGEGTQPCIVNGFQLKPVVPEPSINAGLATGLLGLGLRKRKPRRNQPSEAEVYGI